MDMPVRNQNFTLIEMLVVIAIISILAAMLSPSLMKARQAALAIQCVNNMKQVGLEMQVYTQNYNGFYPYLANPNVFGGDANEMVHKVLCGKEKQDSQIFPLFACPSDPRDRGNLEECYEQGKVGFGINAISFITRYWEWGEGNDNNGFPARINSFTRPGITVFFADSAWAHWAGDTGGYFKVNPNTDGYNPTVYPRHDGRCNILWVDGHCKAIGGNSVEELLMLHLNTIWDDYKLGHNGWTRNGRCR